MAGCDDDLELGQGEGRGLTISCDVCVMQHTSACGDCVVTYLLGADTAVPVVLDLEQARLVRMFGAAGMVPDLKYDVAG